MCVCVCACVCVCVDVCVCVCVCVDVCRKCNGGNDRARAEVTTKINNTCISPEEREMCSLYCSILSSE